jgi:hypothetical protein
MNSNVVFEFLGDLILDSTSFVFENIGNLFNDAMILLGFFGLFFWLRLQKKFNDKAANDPNQLK